MQLYFYNAFLNSLLVFMTDVSIFKADMSSY